MEQQPVQRSARGFSLVEVLLAACLLAAGLAALAHLFALAVAANIAARSGTAAIVLAEQKIEQLRSEPGMTLVAGEGVEYLDDRGTVVSSRTAGAVYVRRWSIELSDGRAAVRVAVGRAGGGAAIDRGGRAPAIATMFTVLTRSGP